MDFFNVIFEVLHIISRSVIVNDTSQLPLKWMGGFLIGKKKSLQTNSAGSSFYCVQIVMSVSSKPNVNRFSIMLFTTEVHSFLRRDYEVPVIGEPFIL